MKRPKPVLIFSVVIIGLVLGWWIFLPWIGSLGCVGWGSGRWGISQALGSEHSLGSQPIYTASYEDGMFLFYAAVSKDTSNHDDVVSPEEYQLYDVVYRMYSDEVWGEEVILTSMSDEISALVRSVVVYQDLLYVFIEEKWIQNYTSYEWNSQTLLTAWNGTSWETAPTVFHQNATWKPARFRDVHSFVLNQSVWVFWRLKSWTLYNLYGYKTFDGVSWSAPKNLTFPTASASAEEFMVIGEELWVVWYDASPVNYNEIYLGKFNGEEIQNVTQITQLDHLSDHYEPKVVWFNGTFLVSWRTAHWRNSGALLQIAVRSVSNGTLGPVVRVSDNNLNNNDNFKLFMFKGNLFVLWVNDGPTLNPLPQRHILIRRSDGVSWSAICELTEGAQFPTHKSLLVRSTDFWVFWIGITQTERKIYYNTFSAS
jgi:hypothetical protein